MKKIAIYLDRVLVDVRDEDKIEKRIGELVGEYPDNKITTLSFKKEDSIKINQTEFLNLYIVRHVKEIKYFTERINKNFVDILSDLDEFYDLPIWAEILVNKDEYRNNKMKIRDLRRLSELSKMHIKMPDHISSNIKHVYNKDFDYETLSAETINIVLNKTLTFENLTEQKIIDILQNCKEFVWERLLRIIFRQQYHMGIFSSNIEPIQVLFDNKDKLSYKQLCFIEDIINPFDIDQIVNASVILNRKLDYLGGVSNRYFLGSTNFIYGSFNFIKSNFNDTILKLYYTLIEDKSEKIETQEMFDYLHSLGLFENITKVHNLHKIAKFLNQEMTQEILDYHRNKPVVQKQVLNIVKKHNENFQYWNDIIAMFQPEEFDI